MASASKPLSVHDHVLIALSRMGSGGTASTLLTYAQSMRPSTTRAYLYKVIGELRNRKQIRTEHKQSPTRAKHYLTEQGQTYVKGLQTHEEA